MKQEERDRRQATPAERPTEPEITPDDGELSDEDLDQVSGGSEGIVGIRWPDEGGGGGP